MNERRASAPLFETDDPGEPGTIAPAAAGEELLRLGRQLPATVHLGTSSWSFPGWRGIVYAGAHGESELARRGLPAYAAHPLLRTVSIDRAFYQQLAVAEYAAYAAAVPPHFRFVVKAPARLTDAMLRSEGGAPERSNPDFLDVTAATDQFVLPALEGLGAKAGPLLLQFSPLPREHLRGEQAIALIERIGAFLGALPRTNGSLDPIYAVELRNPELLTPRFVRMLREHDARLCVGIHARMPDAIRQSAALRAMDQPEDSDPADAWRLAGPLVVRWNLHAGMRYDAAKNRYAPFNRLVDPDLVTRGALSHLVHVALRSDQPAFVIVNNKAEGSAPLSCIELAHAIVRR
jgi:uncharacterized protein YecE (DUF72 family)